MRILQLTDLHYRLQYPPQHEPYLDVLRAQPPLSRRLDRLAAQLAGEPLDGILLTGDLTDYGAEEDHRALRRELERVFPGVPVAVTPGNHDRNPALHAVWSPSSRPLSSAPAILEVSSTFCGVQKGPDGDLAEAQNRGVETFTGPFITLSFFGNLPIICLDSSMDGLDAGCIGEEHCVCLEEKLAQLGQKPSLLITHFHLLPHQHPMPPAQFSPRFAEILEKSSVIALFCGHTHTPYAGFFAGKPYFTAPSFSFHVLRDAKENLTFAPCLGYALYTLEGPKNTHFRFETFCSEE